MEQPITVSLFDAPVVVQDMTRAEAERVEAEIISTGSRMRALVYDFDERRGWEALNHASYSAWVNAIAPRFGFNPSRLFQELTAARIERVLTIVSADAPIPESHLRPLAPLKDDPDALRETWDRAHEVAEQRGEAFTARHVSAAVQEYRAGAPLPAAEPEPEPLSPYEETIAAAYTPPAVPVYAPPALPVSRFNEGLRSSETPEWYTPGHIIEAARHVMGAIDLDPASSQAAQATVQAAEWYGLDHPDAGNRDGLVRDWHGRVWMNPPYGDAIGEWVARLVWQHSRFTTEALALLPARLDTAWWQDNLAPFPFCVLRGRLRFSGARDSAPFPSVVVYLGSSPDMFIRTFHELGLIYRPA